MFQEFRDKEAARLGAKTARFMEGLYCLTREKEKRKFWRVYGRSVLGQNLGRAENQGFGARGREGLWWVGI